MFEMYDGEDARMVSWIGSRLKAAGNERRAFAPPSSNDVQSSHVQHTHAHTFSKCLLLQGGS